MPVTVLETTIVSPSRIRVWILDDDIDFGGTIGPVTAEPGTAYDTPTDDVVEGYKYVILGPNKNYRRVLGTAPDAYLNRVACDVAGDWGVTGNTVTAVYRRSTSYKPGYNETGGIVQMLHYVDLDLLTPLTHLATVTITPPEDTDLAPYSWTWNDRVTVAEGFRVGAGFRPDDPYKKVYLQSAWSWGGVIDPEPETIELINSIGSTVFTAPTTQVMTPSDGNKRYIVDWKEKRHVASITTGAAGTNRINFTAPHGFSGGEVVMLAQWNFFGLTSTFGGGGPVDPSYWGYEYPSVDVIDGDTISLVDRQLEAVPGTVTVGAGSVNVVGTGTNFTYRVVGQFVVIAGAKHLVSAHTDATHITLATPHVAGATNVSVTRHMDATLNGTWVPSTYVERMDGMLHVCREANAYDTFIYEASFDDIEIPPNDYRARKPGLGVGRPFRVDHNVHWTFAQHYAFGVYHHLQGVPYDGRGGLTHPATFIDGDPLPIYWSRMPMSMTYEGNVNLGCPYSLFPDGTESLTAERVCPGEPIVFIKDAGDEDENVYEHTLAIVDNLLIARKLRRQVSPESIASLPPVFPKPSEIRGSGYADLDTLSPDLCLYYSVLETFRRCQRVNGEVPSGFGVMIPHEAGTPNYGGSHARGGSVWDVNGGPLWISQNARPFAAAFEPFTGYIIAGAMYLIAELLEYEGFSARAEEMIDSADLIMDRCAELMPIENGDSYTAIYDYFKNDLGVLGTFMPNDRHGYYVSTVHNIDTVNAGADSLTGRGYYNSLTENGALITARPVVVWSGPDGLDNDTIYFIRTSGDGTYTFYDTAAHASAGGATGLINITGSQLGGRFCYAMTEAEIEENINFMNGPSNLTRILAHGCRYFATGDSASQAIVEGNTPNGPQSYSARGHWAWREYGANAATIRGGQIYDLLYIADNLNGMHPRSVETFTHPFDHVIGNGRQVWRGSTDMNSVPMAYVLNPDDADNLRSIVANMNHDSGANYPGQTNIVGLGYRQRHGQLNLDTTFSGDPIAKGFMAYAVDIGWGYSNGQLFFDAGAGGRWAAESAYVALNNANHYKQVEPYTWAQPTFEQHEDNPYRIYVSEGRCHECELAALAGAQIAHVRGNNTATEPSPNVYRMRCRAAA